jgi:hypothetical protein
MYQSTLGRVEPKITMTVGYDPRITHGGLWGLRGNQAAP